jgi:hypothetical protein
MKKIILLCGVLFFCGCSVTIVYVEKHSVQIGEDNAAKISGSDLKDNQASQSADGTLDIPIP